MFTMDTAHSETLCNTSEPPSKRNPQSRWLLLVKSLQRKFVKVFEHGGMRRVEREDRNQVMSFLELFNLWQSVNLAAGNIILASLGPSIFNLSFLDASLCAIFAAMLGSLPPAYLAAWGPVSGLRTLVLARFTMGWWPSKLCAVLNLVTMHGYSVINCVVAGQILSAISTGLSVDIGIIIVASISLFISTMGIEIFIAYTRYAWLLQTVALCILLGSAGPRFDVSSKSQGDAATINGNRLSFFSLCLSCAITYTPVSGDFLVYLNPQLTSSRKILLATWSGLTTSFSFCYVLGIGLASGIGHDAALTKAGAGSGALIVAGYNGLGSFGSFCSILAACGLIANTIGPAYSSGIIWQILGRYPARIPRWIWTVITTIIYTGLALLGRKVLAVIIQNFLALMGYWVSIWFSITLGETLLFRRGDRYYVWSVWDKKEYLPPGIAAFVTFIIGETGATLCMDQMYFVGPIASLIGSHGGDLGLFAGFILAAVVYPPLRYFEVWKFRR